MKRQEFDLSEQKYLQELENQYLVDTLDDMANVVTADQLI